MIELRFASLFGDDGKLYARLSQRRMDEDSSGEPVEAPVLRDANTQQQSSALASGEAEPLPGNHESSLARYSYPMERVTGEPAGVLSLLIDISEYERTRDALTRRTDFERLITRLSTHFIEVGEHMADESINHALRSIGEFANVDRAYIFLYSADGTLMVNTHEWCAPGIAPEIENLQALPVEVFPWWTERLKRREVIHVPIVEQLGDDAAAEREILKAQSIQSVVVVPLIYAKAVPGFLGFDSVRAQKTWSAEDIALLRVVGEMFMNALERQKAHRLRQSLEDQIVAARSLENVAKLAGGVAHDFNNLLGIILNCAAAISRGLADVSGPQRLPELAKLTAYADDLMAATHQASELTRQLLIIGRRGIVEPAVFSANQVLSKLEHLLERTLGENIRLELRLDDTVECVRLGRPQFEQVIVNLALNARDAMPQGGQFTIATKAVALDDEYASKCINARPGDYVCLTATDTGVGMTPEVLEHAFEPFFTTKGPSGTGLGLSTVHSIVTEAGGHVVLTSSLGKGTTIQIYLQSAGRKEPTLPPPPESASTDAGRGETILVVEDCASLRRLICDALRDNQYRVLEAPNAEEALKLCEVHASHVDLVLSDVVMPGISGRQMAALIAQRFGIARVAYMSGYDDAVLTKHNVLEPGIRLIQKPFLNQSLLRYVREALDGDPPSRGI